MAGRKERKKKVHLCLLTLCAPRKLRAAGSPRGINYLSRERVVEILNGEYGGLTQERLCIGGVGLWALHVPQG